MTTTELPEVLARPDVAEWLGTLTAHDEWVLSGHPGRAQEAASRAGLEMTMAEADEIAQFLRIPADERPNTPPPRPVERPVPAVSPSWRPLPPLPDASSAVPIEDIDTLGALDQREAALDRRRDALNRDLAGATSLAVVADVKRQLEELDDEERVLHNRRPLVARAEQARAEEREARRRAALERHAAEFYLAADPVLDRLVELHRELAPLRERAVAAGVESAEPWSPGINGRGRFEGVWQLLDRIALYVEGEWATTIVPWAEQTVGATTTAGGTAAARAR